MKNKKIFFSIITVSTFILLAGCAAENGDKKTVESETQISTTEQPGTQLQPSAADLAAYTGALRAKDSVYCDKISDNTYKEQCKRAVSDSKNLGEALEKMDSLLCAKLSSKDAQDSCKVQVDIALQEKQKRTAQEEQIQADEKRAQEIVGSGDYAKCQELKLETAQKDCELNILTNKALIAKDISWCSKASKPEYVENCKQAYNIATNNGGTAPNEQ